MESDEHTLKRRGRPPLHPEVRAAHKKAYAKRYWKEHKEEINAKRRSKPRLANATAIQRAWREANRDHYNAYQRAWRKKQKEKAERSKKC